MIVYRRATEADIDALAAFAIDGLRPERQPMLMSYPKIEATIRHFIGPNDFSLMAEEGGKILGAVALMVVEMLWFERSEAHVVMCRATRPGVGRELLKRAMDWCRDDTRIQRVVWSLEDDAPRATARLARMLGFNVTQTICVAHKE